MLSEGRNFLLLSPWSAIFAGFGILFLSFGFNLSGRCAARYARSAPARTALKLRPASAADVPALAHVAERSYRSAFADILEEERC